ncbi:PSD1 and planctomycete cytochrome C domain-containing protein [Niabella pedocola]|uniref:PSD1 and planctomycete cytochrome C domain-containing protein n=1 Tax=Niabella pedocola TaxID=1752077 RepID=A0ABS8PKF6_9BACT|nr:PSD1 and planctomycete cytochrome C domain-containing protein [Niabella pedocola]MCD2421582.1 PSD1 and planctomycete cytochrome C domain-containing protein [Niabella pedocola]
MLKFTLLRAIFSKHFFYTTAMKFTTIAGITFMVFIFSGLAAGCGALTKKSKAKSKISYNYDVRPILSDKCFACHGPDKNKQEAGLRLDIEANAKAPLRETKGAYAIVPGKPEASELVKRITSADPSYQMPTPESHLGVLNEREIDILTRWIKQGAPYEKHWAFMAPQKAPLPDIRNKEWPRNEIDYFIAEKMEEHELQPNEAADKSMLLKRVSLDLTGLLPDLQMQEAFETDNSNTAYEKAVDRLLASPQFGEKMALHWLDISRYADSYGYQDDDIRTQWPYRDWVIHAFNNNMPYDQFITWQLAGDLLPNSGKEQLLATAFLRNHKITEEGGVIPEEYRVEYAIDKVKTFSKGILAMTAECAQCHDHKYDPISQKDYYQLFAFFNTSKEQGLEGLVNSGPAKTPVLTLTTDDTKSLLRFINPKDTARVNVSVMGELDTLRTTYILNRGVYDQHGAVVTAGALQAVMRFDTTRYPKNRLGLAQWTVSKQNPLTARVFVNQLWEQLFGKGIVKTVGDFGMQGNLPTHPELLDWLAVDFMEHGWNMKELIRKMVLSATYRQSSRIDPKAKEKDPDNVYYARSTRIRLPAESIRDAILGSSGLLNKTIGGPSVKPYQPKGLWEAATSGRGALTSYSQDSDSDLYRRGIYTFIKLTVPPPSMIIFDASNRDQCEVNRLTTNTPLQALIMMNDPTVLEASRVFAEKLSEKGTGMEQAIRIAFESILCRKPAAREMEILKKYYTDQLNVFNQKKKEVGKTLAVGEYPHRTDPAGNIKAAALMRVINMIYNMEETIVKV